jgi:hypothetical protein
MEKTMRKIILLGCVSLVLAFGAADADARSSDEEDTPQASAEPTYAPPRYLSPADGNRRAERRPVAGSHRPAAAPAQEDDNVR